MWEQYVKTAKALQVLILVVCLAMYLLARIPLSGVAVIFIVMQLFAFIGAAWSARLRRKIAAKYELPLHARL